MMFIATHSSKRRLSCLSPRAHSWRKWMTLVVSVRPRAGGQATVCTAFSLFSTWYGQIHIQGERRQTVTVSERCWKNSLMLSLVSSLCTRCPVMWLSSSGNNWIRSLYFEWYLVQPPPIVDIFNWKYWLLATIQLSFSHFKTRWGLDILYIYPATNNIISRVSVSAE